MYQYSLKLFFTWVLDTQSFFASKLCLLVASCIFQRLSNHQWKMDIWHAVQSPTVFCIRFLVIVKEKCWWRHTLQILWLPVIIGSCITTWLGKFSYSSVLNSNNYPTTHVFKSGPQSGWDWIRFGVDSQLPSLISLFIFVWSISEANPKNNWMRGEQACLRRPGRW